MKELTALVQLEIDWKKVPTLTSLFLLWEMWFLLWLTCPWARRKCWYPTETLSWRSFFKMLWEETARPSWLLPCLQLISTMMRHLVLYGRFCLSVCLSVCLSICLSGCLSAWLSDCVPADCKAASFFSFNKACFTCHSLAVSLLKMLCAPSNRRRPFSYQAKMAAFEYLRDLSVKRIGINSEKCVQYGK